MPSTLDVTADGRRLRFHDTLRVELLDQDGKPQHEAECGTVSSLKRNELSFGFPGETRTILSVRYGFNKRNQLTVQVVAQPGVEEDSEIWTLPGRILIDDVDDLEYQLIDEKGSLTLKKVTVYGRLSLEGAANQLLLTFADGTSTAITGTSKLNSLSVEEFFSGGDLARDRLRFAAVTRNMIDGGLEDARADIRFHGRWDLRNNSVVFVTKYDNSNANMPIGFLAFGGEFRGTNVGLAWVKDGRAVLQVSGRYQWDRSTLGWQLQVGFSKSAGIEAHLEAGGTIVGKNGSLTINGKATLKRGSETAGFSLDLALAYTAKEGVFVFELAVGQGGYKVDLSGDFKIANSQVTMQITAKDKNGEKSVEGRVEFGSLKKDSALNGTIEALLTPKGIRVQANLEFRFFFGPRGPVVELPT